MTLVPGTTEEVRGVLLRSEVTDGVEVLSVQGPVTDSDAPALATAVTRATSLRPRGVLLDLSQATELSAAAVDVLRQANAAAPGWPRPALIVCTSAAELAGALAAASLRVHRDRADGLGHVDDRSPAPRRRVTLAHSPLSPASARAAAAEAVEALHIEPLADDVSLVVSELVTNAIRYAEAPVTLEIEVADGAVTVAVADGSPGRPVPREPELDAEGGRGLALIDLLAEETGVRPQPPGKTVWATLHRP